MRIDRILCAAAAVVLALSAVAPLTVAADDGKSEEKAIEFTFDKDKLSEKKAPALSFDSADFKDYIHLTRDAKKGGISFEQDKDTAYQGVSLKVSADTKGVPGYFSCAEYARDKEGNYIYNDFPDIADVDNLNFVGIELRAEDFGLSTFDGCLFNFAYRLTKEDEGALMADSVWVFGTNDDYKRSSDAFQMRVNTAMDDNVGQYQSNGLLALSENSNSTRLVFDIAPQNAVSGAVLYLDNITIKLPDSADVGDAKYVANVDGYNENAKISETVEEIKINKNKTDTAIVDKEIEKSEDNTKKNITILVVVILSVAAVGAAAWFLFMKKKFY